MLILEYCRTEQQEVGVEIASIRKLNIDQTCSYQVRVFDDWQDLIDSSQPEHQWYVLQLILFLNSAAQGALHDFYAVATEMSAGPVRGKLISVMDKVVANTSITRARFC